MKKLIPVSVFTLVAAIGLDVDAIAEPSSIGKTGRLSAEQTLVLKLHYCTIQMIARLPASSLGTVSDLRQKLLSLKALIDETQSSVESKLLNRAEIATLAEKVSQMEGAVRTVAVPPCDEKVIFDWGYITSGVQELESLAKGDTHLERTVVDSGDNHLYWFQNSVLQDIKIIVANLVNSVPKDAGQRSARLALTMSKFDDAVRHYQTMLSSEKRSLSDTEIAALLSIGTEIDGLVQQLDNAISNKYFKEKWVRTCARLRELCDISGRPFDLVSSSQSQLSDTAKSSPRSSEAAVESTSAGHGDAAASLAEQLKSLEEESNSLAKRLRVKTGAEKELASPVMDGSYDEVQRRLADSQAFKFQPFDRNLLDAESEKMQKKVGEIDSLVIEVGNAKVTQSWLAAKVSLKNFVNTLADGPRIVRGDKQKEINRASVGWEESQVYDLESLGSGAHRALIDIKNRR